MPFRLNLKRNSFIGGHTLEFDLWFRVYTHIRVSYFKSLTKAQPASSKENDPEWGNTLQRKIRNDFFLDLVWNIFTDLYLIVVPIF